MPDTDAVRSLRKRLHGSGDHSQCRADRCPAAAAGRYTNGDQDTASPDRDSSSEPILPTVIGHLANMDLADDDPRMVSAKCATLLARQIDDHQGPGVRLLVRDLLFILAQIGEFPGDPPHAIDGIRAKIHRKKTELVLRQVASLADL